MKQEISLFFLRHNKYGAIPVIRQAPIYYYDLTIVLDGCLKYVIDGEVVSIESGDAVLFSSGMLREREEQAERADYISFNFHTETPPNLPTVIRHAVHTDVKLMIAAFDEIVKRHPTDHESITSPLLLSLLCEMERNLESSKVNQMTTVILKYLKKNLAQKITLADIGKLTFFSPVYCDTVFKKDMGTSIIDYLLQLRIAEAKNLLIEGSLPLSRIAQMTGFEDGNYFSRVFKKRTGYTPTQYKRITLNDFNKPLSATAQRKI